jgi:hypothetical protein
MWYSYQLVVTSSKEIDPFRGLAKNKIPIEWLLFHIID